MDAFDVLGLAPTLDLDLGVLDQRYRALLRALHPDKFVHASATERRESLSRALSVSDAYRALKDELARAEILFTRFTGKTPDVGQSTADAALLMEAMELREQLASAKTRRDAALGQTLSEAVRKREQVARAALRQAFRVLARAPSAEEHENAARALARLRYYRRFQDEVRAFEDALHDAP
jgi:molecular chaperone HscB